MAYNEEIRQRKNMAMGGGIMPAKDFGCDSLAEVNGGRGGESVSHEPLGDHERAGPPHISRGGGKMPATAHSDHGPHGIPG